MAKLEALQKEQERLQKERQERMGGKKNKKIISLNTAAPPQWHTDKPSRGASFFCYIPLFSIYCLTFAETKVKP